MIVELLQSEILLLKEVAKSQDQRISKAELIGKDQDNSVRLQNLLRLKLVAFCDIDKLLDAEGYVVERDEAGNVIPSHVCMTQHGREYLAELKYKQKQIKHNGWRDIFLILIGAAASALFINLDRIIRWVSTW